jgi:HlyD family secretion protein
MHELEDFEPEIESSEQKPAYTNAVRRNLVIAAITFIALCLIFYFFFWTKKSGEAAKNEEVTDITVTVKTAKAARDALAQEFSTIGTITPIQQATISAGINAQIRQMRRWQNQFVRKGDILAVLNSQDLQAQRAEAEAALREAELNRQTLTRVSVPQAAAQTEKDLSDARAAVDNARVLYERRKDLYDKGGIALKEVEASRLALTNAENNLKLVQKSAAIRTTAANPNDLAIIEARIAQSREKIKMLEAQIALTIVRAPVSGFVTEQFQFEGEFATAGGKLLTIADTSEVIAKANFADTIAADFKIGDAAIVTANDAPEESLRGKITNIARSADIANRTIEVWVNLGNAAGKLRVGAAANVTVSINEQSETVIVPAAAVTLEASNADEGTVMIVGKDGLAHETKVKTGIKNADKIQILSGLNGGEDIIIEGNYALPDGAKVEIADETEEK